MDGASEDNGGIGPVVPRGAVAVDLTREGEYIAELFASVPCPKPSNWEARSVFAASPWLAANDVDVPTSLRRYCRYTWSGASTAPGASAVNQLVSYPGFANINPVVRSVGPQTDVPPDVLTEAAGDELRELAEWKYHHVGAAAVAGTNGDRFPVHLVIIDTEPNGPVQGPSSHGRAMRDIASAAACPEGTSGCAVATIPIVGIPRLGNGTADFAGGGWVAAPSDPAVAMVEAVERWRSINAAPGPQSRLVINLSLGLNKALFAKAPASENLFSATLRYASCNNALIIASSGNEQGHGTSGALWPASLEAVVRPSGAECQAEFGIQPTADNASYRPLVHAVGGMATATTDLSPLTIADSVPRLVAPATMVPRADRSETITGTSVAAATVSGTAALLLSYSPSQSSSAVMQTIYDTGGIVLGNPKADNALVGSPMVRHVRACEALDAACGKSGGLCSFSLACAYGPQPYTADDIAGILAAVATTDAIAPTFGSASALCDAVDGTQLLTYAELGVDACESSDLDDTFAKLLAPQPNSFACLTCGFETDTATATVAINREHVGLAVDAVDVTLFDELGQRSVFHLGPLALSDRKTLVALPVHNVPNKVSRASITIYFASGHSTTDNMLVN